MSEEKIFARVPRAFSGAMSGLRARELSQADLHGLDFKGSDREDSKAETTVEDYVVRSEEDRLKQQSTSLLRDLLDISPLVQDAAAAIVDDSFLRCFQSQSSDPWNWNIYLAPLWAVGVVVRHLILFPLRLILLLGGFLVFFILFFTTEWIFKSDHVKRTQWERYLAQFMCQVFVASWTGVVRYHGPRPVARPNHVWVCNHTSMIDYIILTAYSPFAVIMQLHPGWVGFMQTKVLNCLGCLWFNRSEVKDRQIVSERMRAHVRAPGSTPLLIFPEGTCVNNEYCVMFKRGAFDLGATVCPVAIRYNKIFVDAFWNSKRQSFTAHLVKLMTSWAVVCDVYFLEPQSQLPDETPQRFAERVQRMIAGRAKLQVAPWDGYLKYYTLGVKHPDLIEKRRKVFAERIARHFKPSEVSGAASLPRIPSGGSGSGGSDALDGPANGAVRQRSPLGRTTV